MRLLLLCGLLYLCCFPVAFAGCCCVTIMCLLWCLCFVLPSMGACVCLLVAYVAALRFFCLCVDLLVYSFACYFVYLLLLLLFIGWVGLWCIGLV